MILCTCHDTKRDIPRQFCPAPTTTRKQQCSYVIVAHAGSWVELVALPCRRGANCGGVDGPIRGGPHRRGTSRAVGIVLIVEVQGEEEQSRRMGIPPHNVFRAVALGTQSK
jgi:hypothetical protein